MSDRNQSQLLVALQDLQEMILEAEDAGQRSKLESMGFPVTGIDELRAAQEKLESLIQPGMLGKYRRLYKRSGRAIVPVVDATCTGCFSAIPTSFTSSVNANKVMICETCGRMLYWP